MIHIEKVENGYIVTNDTGGREVAQTTDKLFKKLLMIFEGRCEDFTGAYGKVIIHRSHPETDEFLVRPVAETELMRELAEMKEVNATQAYCLRNHIDSYHDGVVAMGLESDIEELLEHVTELEAELDARRENSKVLMRVVDVVKKWDNVIQSDATSYRTMIRIGDIVEEYTNVLEIPEQTIDPVLREQIAKRLHTMFMAMVQKRQENGSIPGGATDVVRYDQLHELSKEYLYEQVDKILDVLRGAQQC